MHADSWSIHWNVLPKLFLSGGLWPTLCLSCLPCVYFSTEDARSFELCKRYTFSAPLPALEGVLSSAWTELCIKLASRRSFAHYIEFKFFCYATGQRSNHQSCQCKGVRADPDSATRRRVSYNRRATKECHKMSSSYGVASENTQTWQ